MCDFCEHGSKHPLLKCSFNNIGITIKIVNKTQLDGMASVKSTNGAITSVGQSNRIKFCPMCGRDLID